MGMAGLMQANIWRLVRGIHTCSIAHVQWELYWMAILAVQHGVLKSRHRLRTTQIRLLLRMLVPYWHAAGFAKLSSVSGRDEAASSCKK